MRTKRSFNNHKGQIMAEYALIVTLVFAVLVAMIPTLRSVFGGFFLTKGNQISNMKFLPGQSTGQIGSERNAEWTEQNNAGAIHQNYASDNNENNTNVSTPLN